MSNSCVVTHTHEYLVTDVLMCMSEGVFHHSTVLMLISSSLDFYHDVFLSFFFGCGGGSVSAMW